MVPLLEEFSIFLRRSEREVLREDEVDWLDVEISLIDESSLSVLERISKILESNLCSDAEIELLKRDWLEEVISLILEILESILCSEADIELVKRERRWNQTI